MVVMPDVSGSQKNISASVLYSEDAWIRKLSILAGTEVQHEDSAVKFGSPIYSYDINITSIHGLGTPKNFGIQFIKIGGVVSETFFKIVLNQWNSAIIIVNNYQ